MESKVCPICEIEKPASAFYVKKTGRQAGQLFSYCIECSKLRKSDPRTKSVSRNWWLRRKYGISSKDYDRLLEEQDHRCLICGVENNASVGGRSWYLAVDHDHKTGRVRGLLCNQCNRALGMFGDNPELLERGAQYLRRSHGKDSSDEPT